MTMSADDLDRATPAQGEPVSDAKGTAGASGSLGLGIAAGIGASLCCLPIVLLLLGVSGAWMGALTAMTPYRPIFIVLTLVFLGFAFRKLYLVPQACEVGQVGGTARSLRRQRIGFWLAAALVAALIAFPWYIPYVLG